MEIDPFSLNWQPVYKLEVSTEASWNDLKNDIRIYL